MLFAAIDMQTRIFFFNINKDPAAKNLPARVTLCTPPHTGYEGLAMISLSTECAEDSANQTPSGGDYFGPRLIVLVSRNF